LLSTFLSASPGQARCCPKVCLSTTPSINPALSSSPSGYARHAIYCQVLHCPSVVLPLGSPSLLRHQTCLPVTLQRLLTAQLRTVSQPSSSPRNSPRRYLP
jgi:hypothetical protein